MRTPKGRFAVVSELTQKLHSAGLLDVAEDGIITVDDRRIVVLFNRGAEKIFGYGSGEVLGQPLEMLIPWRFADTHPAQVEEFVRNPVVSRAMGERREVYGRCKNGEEFPADVSISKTVVDGQTYMTAIVRDVTERKRAQAAILKLNAELEQRVAERTAALTEAHGQSQHANDQLTHALEELRSTTQQLWLAARLASVGEMAASIAHELNNPLGIVSLRLESVLAKTPLDDSRRRPLEIVEQELDRMAGLVANLLHFSRPGKEEVSSVDVCAEARRTLDLMHPHLKKRGVEVRQELAAESVNVHADRQKLRQVFLNLVSNASDAMGDGGRLTLRVGLRALVDGRPGVYIEIADTGHGIPAELLPRVMEPFFSTKDEGKGTGLGLAICRRIVQEHHGTLQIESEVGRGTTVRITLPAGNETNVDRLRQSS